MPASLLDSQRATLERPGPDEAAITLDAQATPDTLVRDVWAWIDDRASADGANGTDRR